MKSSAFEPTHLDAAEHLGQADAGHRDDQPRRVAEAAQHGDLHERAEPDPADHAERDAPARTACRAPGRARSASTPTRLPIAP